MAVDGYRDQRELRWILLGMSALALQILSGHVQYVYYTAMLAGFYVILNLPKTQKKFSFLLGLLGMGLGAALLTAAQLGGRVGRGLGQSSGAKTSHRYCGHRGYDAGEALVPIGPGFFRRFGIIIGEGGFYWEGATFVSLTAFVLAVFSFKSPAILRKKYLEG